MKHLKLYLVAIAILTISQQLVAAEYTITDLGTLGGNSQATDINNNGQIVGITGSKAFYWDATSGMIDIGNLGGIYTYISGAYGLNDNGEVVGACRDVTDLYQKSFYWTQSTGMIDTGTLGGYKGISYDINNNGEIIGAAHPTAGSNILHGFYAEDYQATKIDIGTLGGTHSSTAGINESGVVVGSAMASGDTYHVFIWQEGQGLTDLGVGNAGAINDNNVIVFYQGTNSFIWEENQPLVNIGSFYAIDINNSNQVVGYANQHSYMWDEINGARDLATLIDVGDWTLLYTSAINESGQIVGAGINPDGQYRAFLLNPVEQVTVPEPASVVLMLTAVSGLGARLRRRS